MTPGAFLNAIPEPLELPGRLVIGGETIEAVIFNRRGAKRRIKRDRRRRFLSLIAKKALAFIG